MSPTWPWWAQLIGAGVCPIVGVAVGVYVASQFPRRRP